LIIATVALRAGYLDMVRASLIGAILANLLLALGLSFFLGGLRYRDQKYNPLAARTYSTMMLIAVISLLVPSAFSRILAPESTIRQEQLLNTGIAVVLLLAYGLYLVFSLKTHPGASASVDSGDEAHHEGKQWSTARAVGSLIAASVLAAWMSEILVGAAEGTGKSLGMTQTFIGISSSPSSAVRRRAVRPLQWRARTRWICPWASRLVAASRLRFSSRRSLYC